MKIEYEKFDNLEKLEFKLFKELDVEFLEPIDTQLNTKFHDLFDSYYPDFIFLIVIKIIKNKIICCNDNYFYLFDNALHLKVGEIFYLRDGEIFGIETSILDENFLDECLNKLAQTNKIDKDLEIKNNFLKKEDIEKEIEKTITETEQERLDRLQEKKEEKEKESGKYEEKKKYEKESIFKPEGKDVKVDKNKIEIGNKKFVLTKNVNKILDYDFIRGYYTSYPNRMKEKLVKKEEGFIFYDWDKKIYELKFETNKKEEIIKSLEEKEYYSKAKINGVRVRRNKICSILERINKDTTKEDIKLWNKFTQKQLDLLKVETIYVDGINVSIIFSYGSKDNFLVELFGKKAKLDWNFLNKMFFYGGESRTMNQSPSISKFIEFSQRLGFTKQELYDKLKQLSKKNEN